MAAAALLGATDIGKILRETGPVVTCVLLRHQTLSGKDDHPIHLIHQPNSRPVLAHMIEEIQLDTTPRKSQVQAILGGPWTFLGQYESEGIMIMMRKPLSDYDDLQDLETETLQELCQQYKLLSPETAEDNNSNNNITRDYLLETLQQAQEHMESQINPHKLQPPFDHVQLHGDLLLLKVAETDEALDRDDDDEDKDEDDGKKPKAATTANTNELTVLTNSEFFLNYTKEEYIAFASRTDVVAPPMLEEHSEEDDDDDSEEDDDDDSEDDFMLGEDEDDDDMDQGEKEGLLNLLMNELLRRFREEHGRGPTTEELLDLRSVVAERLGVQVATVLHDDENNNNNNNEEDSSKKRAAANDEHADTPSKKVKFSADDDQVAAADDDDEAEDASSDEEDKKLPATESES
jgi:hypothetical protein